MKKVNSLSYTASKEIGNNQILTVKIRLNDECRNGHEDFSITGDITERQAFVAGGCIHEEILKHFPEFSDFISLHLCQFDGTPMHAIANGYYWLKEGNIENVKSTLNATDKDIETLIKSADQSHFKYLVNALNLPARWKISADNAINHLYRLINENDGQPIEFVSEATTARNESMTNEEMAKFKKNFVDTGYYSKGQAAKRRQAKQKVEKIKAMAEIQGADIYFKGKKYHWIGWRHGSAPLCTKEQFENFEVSDGHIYPQGISRFGEKIGDIADIQKEAKRG